MPKVPYSYEVNGKLVTGNGSLFVSYQTVPLGYIRKKNLCSSSWFREILLGLQMYRKSDTLHKDYDFIVKRTCYDLRTEAGQITKYDGRFTVGI